MKIKLIQNHDCFNPIFYHAQAGRLHPFLRMMSIVISLVREFLVELPHNMCSSSLVIILEIPVEMHVEMHSGAYMQLLLRIS